jgi:hypothetical protein
VGSDLGDRLALIDSFVRGGGELATPAQLASAFVDAMVSVSNLGTPPEVASIVEPDTADEVVAESLLLRSLLDQWSWLERGPSARDCAQHWIVTGKPAWVPEPVRVPDRAAFQPSPDSATLGGRPPHPAEYGFYTSSATSDYAGMWRTFLEQTEWMGLSPKPWSTWLMRPRDDLRIFQVTCAADWAQLVDGFHVGGSSDLHADWHAVASAYDAVHFSPRAVGAVQGFRIRTRSGLTAPVYWDVESTLWLRWPFESWSLVDTQTL